jgi:cytochrome c oxidase subunit 4
MSEQATHITSYKTLGIILVTLLFLTCITILVTSLELHVWNVVLALIIACIKGFLVVTYFMHIKHENILLRILVGMVFALFALIIVITFFDYLYR